jgi:type II secretory pathway pseudopilin PulG
MKNSSRVEGFTIFETLIVLAVTTFLFVGAAAVISGRQANTQFSQGLRDVQSRVQTAISEVDSGSYVNNGNFDCSVSGTGPRITPGSTAQGSNEACLYLGKVLHMAVGASPPETANIYTIVGLRRDTTGAQVTSLAAAKPRLIAQGFGDPGTMPQSIDTITMPYGLTVSAMYYNNNPANRIGAVGFVSNVGMLATGDASQQVNVVPMLGTLPGQSQSSIVNATRLNLLAGAPAINPARGVQICLAGSRGDAQYGLITIGGQGRQLDVSLVNKTTANCQ